MIGRGRFFQRAELDPKWPICFLIIVIGMIAGTISSISKKRLSNSTIITCIMVVILVIVIST